MMALIVSNNMNKALEHRLAEQTKGVPHQQVYVIELLSIRFGKFDAYAQAAFQQFSNLQMLVLNDCGLTTLDHFPHFYNLIRLDLVFNELDDDCFQHLSRSKRMQCLMLGANKVAGLDGLHLLSDHKDLIQLDLLNNPVQKTQNFRQKVYKILPQLKVLDTLDINGNDAFFVLSMKDSAKFYDPTRFQPDGARPLFGAPFGAPAPFPFPHVPLVPPARAAPVVAPLAVPLPLPVVAIKNKKQGDKLRAGLVRTKSYDSMNGKQKQLLKQKKEKKQIKRIDSGSRGIKTGKAGKAGKAGKLDKVDAAKKRRTLSQKVGLVLPVGRIRRNLRAALPTMKVRLEASVYLAATMQYLLAELLETTGRVTKQDKRVRINENDVHKALKEDPLFK